MKHHYEDDLQSHCVHWFRYQYPQRIIFAIPNGGKRNRREAGRLKAQGVTAGVPDLCIPEPGGYVGEFALQGSRGLWIELKVGKNDVTEKQQGMIDALRQRGYAVHVCYSLDEFMSVVNAYFGRGK